MKEIKGTLPGRTESLSYRCHSRGQGRGTKKKKEKKKKNTHEDEAMQSEWVRELVPGLSDVFLSKKVCSHKMVLMKYYPRRPEYEHLTSLQFTITGSQSTLRVWFCRQFFDSPAVKFRYFSFQEERMTTPTQQVILPPPLLPPQKVYGRYPLNAKSAEPDGNDLLLLKNFCGEE